MSKLETRVTQTLDGVGIAYQVLQHNRPVFTVEDAASARGIEPELLVKSILLREKKGRYVMACVPGNLRLDPKAVRAELGAGWRRMQFATREEVLEQTGYIQGAVAPVDLAPEIPILFDSTIGNMEKVSISSGDPGFGLLLSASALIAATAARLAHIAIDGPVSV